MVAVPVGLGIAVLRLQVDVVVLMFLRSIPAPTSALITACWRSFVWFIAVVTSGAVNSMLTFGGHGVRHALHLPRADDGHLARICPGRWCIVFVACGQRDDGHAGGG